MVSLFSSASILIRAGRGIAFALPLAAAVAFGTDLRAQTANIFFYPAPLTASPSSFAALDRPQTFENYAVGARTGLLNSIPKFDFGSSEAWKEYISRYKDDTEGSFGRVPLNGGSFGLEAENKFDLKKIAPIESVDSNIERHSKKPFVGLSIVAPYNSE